MHPLGHSLSVSLQKAINIALERHVAFGCPCILHKQWAAFVCVLVWDWLFPRLFLALSDPALTATVIALLLLAGDAHCLWS